MDSAKVSDWMQIVGIFSVVVSLVFVGLQLRQSQEIAIAEQFHNRALAYMSLLETRMEIGYVPDISDWRDRVNQNEVQAEDISNQIWLWISMDDLYYQYQLGFMDESAWQAQLINVRGIFANCKMRFIYDWRRSGLRSEFVELVETGTDLCADIE